MGAFVSGDVVAPFPWLRNRALQRGDTAAALALSETLFWQHPSLAGYDELRKLAQGEWTKLRGSLMRRPQDEA